MGMPKQGAGPPSEIGQALVRKEMGLDKEEAVPEAVMPPTGRNWWVQTADQPVLTAGAEVQAFLDASGVDTQIMSEDHASGWIKASEAGFVFSVKADGPAEVVVDPDTQAWETLPDAKLVAAAGANRIPAAPGDERVALIAKLVAAGVSPPDASKE